MSVAHAPAVQPRPQAPGPEIVRPNPQKPSNTGVVISLLIALVMLGGAALLWQRRTAPAPTAALTSVGVRTAKALPGGRVQKTLRITGVTVAENFVSLVVPQMRGSRSDRQRDNSAASTPTTASSATTSASGSTTGGAAGSGSSSNANGTAASGNGSSALQSATSRFGGSLRGSSSGPRASASSGTPPTSSTFGASGIGSALDTNNPTGGGGGGGGGQNDFMLVLQHSMPGGSHVHKGDTIAEFDRQYMLLRLDDYKASVFQSEAALTKQKAELEITQNAHRQLIDSAKGSLEKARLDLKTIPVLSAMDTERAKLAFEQAEAKYKQLLNEVKFVKLSQEAEIQNATLNLEQAQLELKRAEANTDRMIVKSPIDGVVVMQSMFRGAEFGQIQEGDQLWAGMFFMQVVNPSSMVIKGTVNQVDSETIRVGSKAKVHFDAYPGLTLAGHVISIAAVTKPAGSRPNFVKEVPVRIKLDNMDSKVIPDLSVSAEVVLETQENSQATVPVGAVFNEGTLGKKFVLVQEPGGWSRRQVELGTANNLVAAIKSGLRPGEVVALDQPHAAEGKN